MKNKKYISKGDAWVLLIAGVIMGTVFCVGMQYWNAPIKQEDAISLTAVYTSYKEQLDRGRVKEIIIRIEEYEQLHIDGVCIDEELRDSIHELTPGTQLSLMVHPNSDTIMDMKVGSSTLLNFQDTSQKITSEANGFMVLGLFCYVLSVYGMISLLFRKER